MRSLPMRLVGRNVACAGLPFAYGNALGNEYVGYYCFCFFAACAY